MSLLLLLVLSNPLAEARLAGDYEAAYALLMKQDRPESLWEAARLAADQLQDPARASMAAERLLAAHPKSPDGPRAEALLEWLKEAPMRPGPSGDLRAWVEAHPKHPQSTLAAVQASQSMPASEAIDFVQAHRGGPYDWLAAREIGRRQLVSGRYVSAYRTFAAGAVPGAKKYARRAIMYRRLLPALAGLLALLAIAFGYRRWRARR